MSRSSNRGPRADIALLRKLKADPDFSPSTLLNSGPNILEKANKLKDFVENQRGKLGAAAAKTEWLLSYQQLQSDQDDAERELTACVQQIADSPATDQLREMAEVALVTLYDQTESCRAERHRLRSQVKGMSSVHASLKAYGGPASFSVEAATLKAEMSATAQELESVLVQLTKEAAVLGLDVRGVWPSALGSGMDGGLASSSAAGSCDPSSQLHSGYTRSEDCEELERMLARYPLGSPDIKQRIREVLAALQDKFLERLDAWRLESERTARDLASNCSTTSTSFPQQRPSRRPSLATTPNNNNVNPSASKPGAAIGTTAIRSGSTAPAHVIFPARAAASGKGGRTGVLRGGRGSAESVVAGRGPPSATAQTPSGAAASFTSCTPKPAAPDASSAVAGAAGSGGSVRDAKDMDLPGAAGEDTGGGGGATEDGDQGVLAAVEAAAAVVSGVDVDVTLGNTTSGNVSEGDGGAAAAATAFSAVAGGSGWAFSGYGGWSAEEHSAFLRHRDRLMEGGTKSTSREAVMSRMVTLLPSRRTVAELLSHDDWTSAARLLGRKRRDLTEAWDRERRQFLEDSASFLKESETLFLVQAEEAADRLVVELHRVRARDDLEVLRAERVREEEVAAVERSVQEAAEAEARLQAEARERRERALKKDMVAAYRAELERQQVELLTAAEEAERQAAAAAEHLAVYNRGRVEVRQAEYQCRQEQSKERQAAAEAAEVAREKRLAQLRALVAPEVENDPQRVMAPTVASSAADKDKDAEGAFHPVHGYTTDQVAKDQRFKVYEALAALGLHGTSYGRQAIAAARPPKASRPDNLTSEQRETAGGQR